jgi:hypothetical protein
MARKLASVKEQVSWLQDASTQFVLWLVEVAATVKRFLQSSEPDKATLTALTTSDCAPAAHLRHQQASKSRLDESRQAFSWMASTSTDAPPDPSNLPLLSENMKLLTEIKSTWPSTAKLIKVPAGFRPTGKSKRGKGEELGNPNPKKTKVAPPGSDIHLLVWISATLLLFGRTVWNVGQICADFSVTQSSRCWLLGSSVLLSAGEFCVAAGRHSSRGRPCVGAFHGQLFTR